MAGRPTKRVIGLELAALVAAAAVALWADGDSNWKLPLLLVLLGASVVGDLTALDTPASRVKVSSSFLTIVIAVVLLGETPAALIGVVTIAAGWLRFRYAATTLLINLVTYAWFPLLAGLAFNGAVNAAGVDHTDSLFYLLAFALFGLALVVDYLLIAGYFSYVEASRFGTKLRRMLVPVLPSELVSGLIAVGVAYMYFRVGLATVTLLAIALIVLQYLIGSLVISQQRADELELRAKQLAGFQVALLGALLRTLDLRDRMTARHSAAVARYSREIAAAAGLPTSEQELVHTAGLLHDIGKFVLPDRILKGDIELTEIDWEEIKKHPYEGARIVSQIDGYQPVSEIVLAHHERIDGLGYPRGMQGEEIPALARIIAVADTYDVLTARDSYRRPVSSYEAITELRRVAGTQLDAQFVETLIDVLADKGFAYRHGEDADFEAELALDKRIHEYVTAGTTTGPRLPV
ncbi:MAG TPA: HD-GYP domain-containing protein [Solirubrobacterales bacterium]|nr:HD-GYP domain-containing protein [Solirubrobacterales bacterium]